MIRSLEPFSPFPARPPAPRSASLRRFGTPTQVMTHCTILRRHGLRLEERFNSCVVSLPLTSRVQELIWPSRFAHPQCDGFGFYIGVTAQRVSSTTTHCPRAATIIQAVRVEQAMPCTKCRTGGTGFFMSCVTRARVFGGACANCC